MREHRGSFGAFQKSKINLSNVFLSRCNITPMQIVDRLGVYANVHVDLNLIQSGVQIIWIHLPGSWKKRGHDGER